MIIFLDAMQLNSHDLDIWVGSLSLPCWDFWAWHLFGNKLISSYGFECTPQSREKSHQSKTPWGMQSTWAVGDILLHLSMSISVKLNGLSCKMFIDLQCMRPWKEGWIQGLIYLLCSQRSAAKYKAIRSHVWGVVQCGRTFCECWMATYI